MSDEAGDDKLRKKQERAKEHPVRVAILGLLGGREMTAAALAGELPDKPPLSAIAYHLAVLVDARLVRKRESPSRLFSAPG